MRNGGWVIYPLGTPHVVYKNSSYASDTSVFVLSRLSPLLLGLLRFNFEHSGLGSAQKLRLGLGFETLGLCQIPSRTAIVGLGSARLSNSPGFWWGGLQRARAWSNLEPGPR